MPCLYSLKTMYRRLPFIILLSILAVFALRASVVAPSILVQNYSVDDYKASCQNWDLAVSYHGILYVANNSGLVTFDGNTWNTYPLPDKTPIYKVSFQNDSIYTQGKSSLGYWLYDELGNLEYHPIDTLPSHVGFDNPETNYTIPKEIEEKHPTSFASAGGLNFTGTSTSGIYITNDEGEIFQHLNINNQLQDNIVRSICVQDNNLIWVALDNGISQIDINPPIAMLGKRSQIGKLEDAVKEDNRLYIRTNLGYFSRSLMFGDKFTPISGEIGRSYIHPDTADNHLSVSTLFKNKDVLGVFANAESIYPVPDNLYWLTIQNEAGLFHRENGTGTLKCRILFDNYDLNLVTNGKRIIPLNDSLDLVSAMQGTLLINTRQLIEGSLGGLTMPRFMRIEYQDQEGTHYLYPDTQRINMPHNFQELSLYIGTTVFTPNHQISYKLEGVSADWSSWQKDGKITFLQLPEGTYELRVRKYVTRGPFPEITMQITVRPPWYNTVWAYLIYVALIWFAIQEGLRYHLRNLRKKEQEKLEAERQAELQRLQQMKSEMLETELQNKNNELTLQTTALVKRNEAIQALLEELDVKREEVIAIGDGVCDVTMIQLAGLGVAMGHSQDSVKICADYVTASNEEDGVAIAVEKAIIAEVRAAEIPLDQLNAQARHALMGNLGIQYTYAAEDRVEATMPVDHRTRQPFGILHGGASLALAETVAGLGSMILCQPDEIVVGMQVSGNHISSAHEGDTVRAVATIVHKGRSSHVWNVDVFTSTNKLVSSIRVVNSVMKKR